MMIDLFLLLVVGYSFFLGFSRGIIQTMFTILSYVFGLIAAFKLSPAATRFLETALGSDNALLFIAGFLLAFFGTMLFIRFLAKMLSRGLESANINIINQMAGGMLLAAITTLLYSLLIWFGVQSHIIKQTVLNQSMSYPLLKEYPTYAWNVAGKLKPTVLEFWDHSVDFMDRMEKISIERTESEPDIYTIEENRPRR